MSAATKEILLNREVIAVDQDSLGRQGILVWEPSPEFQVWSKPLADGSHAVALLNRSMSAAKITANLSRVGLHTDSAIVRDLWAHADRGRVGRQYSVEVPAHAVVMVKMTALR
jgi:alpha-galactosidase